MEAETKSNYWQFHLESKDKWNIQLKKSRTTGWLLKLIIKLLCQTVCRDFSYKLKQNVQMQHYSAYDNTSDVRTSVEDLRNHFFIDFVLPPQFTPLLPGSVNPSIWPFGRLISTRLSLINAPLIAYYVKHHLIIISYLKDISGEWWTYPKINIFMLCIHLRFLILSFILE